MSESERVQRWRQRQRASGKEPLTIWLTTEEKLRLEDMALSRRCSASELVQLALAHLRGESLPVTDTVTDTEQLRSVTDTVTVTEPKHRGRKPVLREPILALLRKHQAGLTAAELKVYLHTEKPISDTLSGMVKAELLVKVGSGKAVRYLLANAALAPSRP